VDNRGSSTLVANDPKERSIGDVLKDIGTNIQDIVRSELKLAKIEVTDSVAHARSSAIMFAGGGVLALFALGFILLAGMFALELVLPGWLAALIVGVVLFIGAAVGLMVGRKKWSEIRAPKKTLQTIKEDIQWTKEQTRS